MSLGHFVGTVCIAEFKAVFCILLIASTENIKAVYGSIGSILPEGMLLLFLSLGYMHKILRHI